MAVRVIQASEVSAPARRPEPALLRVAAYCRVSTDTDEQKSSYEAQRRHYLTSIAEHPDWTLAGIFADEGISGTQARRRPEFLRMIEGCEAGQIDLVITKSISRFARNTLDCLNYIRRLKELGIPVIFEKESINTMEAAGEVLVTILASLAQQESASISQNVKMGIRYVMREGRGRVNYTQFLGYTQGPTKGSLVIVPEEARIVRRIFRAYLEGYSPAHIAARLEDARVASPTGGSRWHASTVASILRNEKYCGDLLLQKYFTPDFLTHKVVRNEGQLPQYFVEDHHEPIVPKRVFRQVQDERLRRSRLRGDPSRLRFGSREALRGRLVCGKCGRTLRRIVRVGERLAPGETAAPAHPRVQRADWCCHDRALTLVATSPEPQRTCDLRKLAEADARALILAALNELPARRAQLRGLHRWEEGHLRRLDALAARTDEWLALLRERLDALGEVEAEPAADSAEARSLQLQANAAQAYRARLSAERAEHAHRAMQLRMLLELAEQLGEGAPSAEGQPLAAAEPDADASAACADPADFFRRTRYRVPPELLGSDGRLARFDDALVTRYLGHVLVRDDGCEVVLKAGIRICP